MQKYFACFLNCLIAILFYFQVPQNWGAGELDFGEGVEFGTIEIVLDNQLVKSQSVNVNIAISDDNNRKQKNHQNSYKPVRILWFGGKFCLAISHEIGVF